MSRLVYVRDGSISNSDLKEIIKIFYSRSHNEYVRNGQEGDLRNNYGDIVYDDYDVNTVLKRVGAIKDTNMVIHTVNQNFSIGLTNEIVPCYKDINSYINYVTGDSSGTPTDSSLLNIMNRIYANTNIKVSVDRIREVLVGLMRHVDKAPIKGYRVSYSMEIPIDSFNCGALLLGKFNSYGFYSIGSSRIDKNLCLAAAIYVIMRRYTKRVAVFTDREGGRIDNLFCNLVEENTDTLRRIFNGYDYEISFGPWTENTNSRNAIRSITLTLK